MIYEGIDRWNSPSLEHYGVPGMKWGVRREYKKQYKQNRDKLWKDYKQNWKNYDKQVKDNNINSKVEKRALKDKYKSGDITKQAYKELKKAYNLSRNQLNYKAEYNTLVNGYKIAKQMKKNRLDYSMKVKGPNSLFTKMAKNSYNVKVEKLVRGNVDYYVTEAEDGYYVRKVVNIYV